MVWFMFPPTLILQKLAPTPASIADMFRIRLSVFLDVVAFVYSGRVTTGPVVSIVSVLFAASQSLLPAESLQ